MNDQSALTLLLARGALTRLQLSEATGLSGPTVSSVIARLTAAGLVSQAGATSGSRGPNAVLYHARVERFCGVAVHIRGSRLFACFVEPGVSQHRVIEVRRAERKSSAVEDLSEAIDAACSGADRDRSAIRAVCVGLPGAVSPISDTLSFIGSLPGWPRRHVRARLEERLGIDVLIGNDANFAATAEARVGGDDFALAWLGEGLGVANVTAGQVSPGAGGGAGEIGYLPISAIGASLDPKAGDLQGLAGAGAVTRLVRAWRPSVRSYGSALVALRADERRPMMLADLAPRVAEALSPVIAVIDPGEVVLSGPTGAAGGEELAGLVQDRMRQTTRWRTPIVATAVPDHPILRGATLTLIDHLTELMLGQVTAGWSPPVHN
ncbi:MAG: ROK family transcriptional regulator [Propionibacteriaceae bacterium]|jgi:predicted NBD/HSP70 family sugar kinase|nr:ROK family transcriptional regulator [Propionibacteriaceae bacterium]